jgi:hypothetical protein
MDGTRIPNKVGPETYKAKGMLDDIERNRVINEVETG